MLRTPGWAYWGSLVGRAEQALLKAFQQGPDLLDTNLRDQTHGN